MKILVLVFATALWGDINGFRYVRSEPMTQEACELAVKEAMSGRYVNTPLTAYCETTPTQEKRDE